MTDSTKQMDSVQVLCILPAYNEEGEIGRVVQKVTATGCADRIVVVDDCSTDRTSEEGRAAGATVIRHEKNQGVGAGIRTGLRYGRENGFDIAVIMSGDDQHEPKELPPVLTKLQESRRCSCRVRGGSKGADGECAAVSGGHDASVFPHVHDPNGEADYRRNERISGVLPVAAR